MSLDAGVLAGLRTALAGLLDEAGVAEAAGGVYAVGGTTVGVLGPDGLELRLTAVVARAAAGTPDAGPSARGPEWVRFAPTTLDRFALDRATSWFGLAARSATAGND